MYMYSILKWPKVQNNTYTETYYNDTKVLKKNFKKADIDMIMTRDSKMDIKIYQTNFKNIMLTFNPS